MPCNLSDYLFIGTNEGKIQHYFPNLFQKMHQWKLSRNPITFIHKTSNGYTAEDYSQMVFTYDQQSKSWFKDLSKEKPRSNSSKSHLEHYYQYDCQGLDYFYDRRVQKAFKRSLFNSDKEKELLWRDKGQEIYAGESGGLVLRNERKGAVIRHFNLTELIHKPFITCVDVDFSRLRLLAGLNNGEIVIWNLKTGKYLTKIISNCESPTAIKVVGNIIFKATEKKHLYKIGCITENT